MSVLLDTHFWIWWVTGQEALRPSELAALDALAEESLPVISAISLWEAQMLHERNRLRLEVPFETWLMQAAAPDVVTVRPIDVSVVLELNRLPQSFHGDPADRMIVATARASGLPVATRDGRIRKSRLIRLWKP